MEIYRNATDATVSLEIPAEATSIDVEAISNGRVIYEFSTVEHVPGSGIYTVTIPWHLARQDRDFYIDWKFTYVEAGQPYQIRERMFVQILTPLLSIEEIAAIANYDLATEEGLRDAQDLERRVRFAIQSYTGQNFGKFYGVMRSSGNNGNKLSLPAPLLEFVGMSFDGIYRPNYGITVANDGWSLLGGAIEITSIKQAPPEWMLDRFDYVGKISAPIVYNKHTFEEGVEYTVEGIWGYGDVPGDVKQAARLLCQDYSCDESLWRERYINSVQAADWRFQFDSRAFAGTGNVQADQILSGYRRQTMVVI